MKKILTFVFASMLVLMVSASANAAQVILNSQTNYEINIDGRVYNNGVGTTTITNLAMGSHSVEVYQVVSNGIFGIGRKRNLLSSQQFTLGNNDVRIDVSESGQVRVSQPGNGGYNNNGDYNNNRGSGPGNSDWGHQQGNNGNKYGHNKNKKAKKNHGNKGRDNDDDNYNRRENN